MPVVAMPVVMSMAVVAMSVNPSRSIEVVPAIMVAVRGVRQGTEQQTTDDASSDCTTMVMTSAMRLSLGRDHGRRNRECGSGSQVDYPLLDHARVPPLRPR